MVSLVLGIALAQTMAPDQGVYRPVTGAPVSWSVSPTHTLYWNSEAYVPVGLRIQGTPEMVAEAKAAGASDVLVELPAGGDWGPTVEALEKNAMRYAITIGSAAPGAFGWVVDPAKYRRVSITKTGPVVVKLPGATRVWGVLTSDNNGDVQWSGELRAENDTFVHDAQIGDSTEHPIPHTLAVYPLTSSLGQIDAWEDFDAHRDRVLASLRRTKFGPGFRALFNPAGETVSLRATNDRVIPVNRFYQMELAQYLEKRYRSVQTCMRAWQMGGNALETFEDLTRLVPMFGGARGPLQLWDPKSGDMIRVGNRNNSVWADVQTVIDTASARRFDRLATAIRQVVDVPVVQDWRGWAAPYEGLRLALTGVAARVAGVTPSELADDSARAVSSVKRWGRPGWAVASEIDSPGGQDARMPNDVVADLALVGVRGFYFKSDNPERNKAFIAASMDSSLTSLTPSPCFYPENATSPGAPQRLPGAFYWYPAPAAGNSLDLGANFVGYRYSDLNKPFTAIWTNGAVGRAKLRLLAPQSVVFETLDGFDPKPKTSKNGVEVAVGELPILVRGTDEIPVPEAAYLETVAKFDKLVKAAEGSNRDVAQEKYNFKDAANGFDRNPAGSFAVMRTNYWRATLKMAPYTWIEAEGTRNHNFSEAIPTSGACGGGVLSLRTFEPGFFRTEYNVPVRNEEEQNVWIAGRLPAHVLARLNIEIDSQSLFIEPTPFGGYGQGLFWYKAGTTRLAGASAKVAVSIDADRAIDAVIDAIVISPTNYEPRGSLPMELALTRS